MKTGATVGGRLKFGSVLKRSYAIFLGNLSTFFFITLVATSPLYALYFWFGYDLGLGPVGDATGTLLQSFAIGMLSGLLISALVAIATGYIVYGAMRELQGRPAGFRDVLSHGSAVLFPVVLTALLSSVIVLFGLALLVIPGLILGALFWVVFPVVVVERRGPVASLRRSIDLTKGYRWPIFGLMLLYGAISAGFGYASVSFLDYESAYLRSLLLDWSGTVVIGAYFAVVATVTYFDLKQIKEGTLVDEIASVFD